MVTCFLPALLYVVSACVDTDQGEYLGHSQLDCQQGPCEIQPWGSSGQGYTHH